jgi:hypothetical protein
MQHGVGRLALNRSRSDQYDSAQREAVDTTSQHAIVPGFVDAERP